MIDSLIVMVRLITIAANERRRRVSVVHNATHGRVCFVYIIKKCLSALGHAP